MKKAITSIIALFALSIGCNAQWVRSTQNYGIAIKCFASKGDTVIAGSDEKFFLSTNGGASWVKSNIGFGQYEVSALMLHNDKIYAGTSSGTTSGAVYVSKNYGNSWTGLKANFPGYPTCLGANTTKLFAGANEAGLFTCTDDAATWTAINIGVPNADVRTLAVNGTTIYVGTWGANGVYMSTDNGATWTNPMTGLPQKKINSLAIKGNTIYAGTGLFLYASTDNCATWTRKGTNVDGTVNSVVTDGTKVVVACTSGKVYSSADDVTFTEITTGLPTTLNGFNGILHLAKNALYLGVEPTRNINGACGVYKSINNGTSWNLVNNGLISQINGVFTNNGNVFTAATSGAYISSNSGSVWSEINAGIDRRLINYALDGSTIYAGTNGGIYKTSDNGTNWTALSSGKSSRTGIYATGAVLYNVAQMDLYCSTDKGLTWFKGTGIPTTILTSFATNSAVDSVAFMGVMNNGIFRTIDKGVTWTAVNTGINTSTCYAIASDGTTIYASPSFNGMYKSIDNGANWVAIKTGLPAGLTGFTILIDGTNLYLGTLSGEVFYSNNQGGNWINVSSGLMGSTVRSLATDGTTLYAGTEQHGVFKRPLVEFASATNVSTYPTSLLSTVLSESQIQVSWTDASTNEDNFVVERNSSIASPTWTQVAMLPANTVTYTDMGLTPETSYLYRVVAKNAGGNSVYSNIVCATTLSNITGIANESNLVSDKNVMYPNPTSGTINFTGLKTAKIVVFDIMGKEVYSTIVNKNESINLNHLTNGLYAVTIIEDSKQIIQKLIIQK